MIHRNVYQNLFFKWHEEQESRSVLEISVHAPVFIWSLYTCLCFHVCYLYAVALSYCSTHREGRWRHTAHTIQQRQTHTSSCSSARLTCKHRQTPQSKATYTTYTHSHVPSAPTHNINWFCKDFTLYINIRHARSRVLTVAHVPTTFTQSRAPLTIRNRTRLRPDHCHLYRKSFYVQIYLKTNI